MSNLQKWRCHKVVEAFKIQAVTPPPGQESGVPGPAAILHGPNDVQVAIDSTTAYRLWSMVERESGSAPNYPDLEGGYFVRYEDGYQSWSPAEAFENGYTPLDGATYRMTVPDTSPRVEIEVSSARLAAIAAGAAPKSSSNPYWVVRVLQDGKPAEQPLADLVPEALAIAIAELLRFIR